MFAGNIEIEVTGESGTLDEAIEMIKIKRPDIVFLNVFLLVRHWYWKNKKLTDIGFVFGFSAILDFNFFSLSGFLDMIDI